MNKITTSSDYKFTAEPPHTNAYLAPAVIDICRDVRANRVLDIGCGNGALAKALLDAGLRKVVGCDPSHSGIEHARSVSPMGRFYELGIYDDPASIAESDFDVAVSTEVVEHLFYPRELPRFAYAKLRPGGLLVLSTPYHGYLKNLLLSVTNKWDDHHTALWDGGHIKFWSRQTLTSLVEEEGFRFEHFLGLGRVPYVWMSMLIVARKI